MKIKLLMITTILLSSNYCLSMHDKEMFFLYENNRNIAQAYYIAMAEKNIDSIAQYLDEEVVFIAPLAMVVGKQAFLERVEEFFAYSGALIIRTVFGSQDQAMVVFTSDYPAPIGIVDFSALLDIQDGLITRIELFYDGRLFEKR